MRQVSKRKVVSNPPNKKSVKKMDSRLPNIQKPAKKRKHPDFGTSKLEQAFAKNFLDKLGVKYIWQYEAKEIKRFYDYYLPDSRILIEVDGDYW